MARSAQVDALRKRLQPVHRRIAGGLPLAARRRYLYLAGQGRLPRLKAPQSFTEKVNWRIIHDRRSVLAWTCDKQAMKAYAASLTSTLDLSVPETMWAGSDPKELLGQSFQSPWVLKPNHRS